MALRWLESFSPAPVVRLHYRAMREDGAESLSIGDRTVLFVLPLAVGLGLGVGVARGLRLTDGVSQVLAATALLVGVMLTSFVFLTNLRIKVSESATYAFRSDLQRLIGGAAVSCLYVAGVALVAAGGLASVASLGILRAPQVRPYTVGVLAAVLVHLSFSLISVIRRLLGTYYEIFASDFTPYDPRDAHPDPLSEGTQKQPRKRSQARRRALR